MLDNRRLTWFTGLCVDCGCHVIITQPTQEYCDYWYYCSNKECKNHNPGEQLGDMDWPTWVNHYPKVTRENIQPPKYDEINESYNPVPPPTKKKIVLIKADPTVKAPAFKPIREVE